MSEITVDQLKNVDPELLEKALKDSKEKRKRQQEKAKKGYEAQRDKAIMKVIALALEAEKALQALGRGFHETMEDQYQKRNEYAGANARSFGGFTITHGSEPFRIRRKYQSKPQWDERAEMGEQLLKEFLADAVKKRDQNLYEILISFLEKNQDGHYEYSRIMNLYQHADKFTDERWVKALRLFKESFNNTFTRFYFEAERQDATGKWVKIETNFSNIKLAANEPEKRD
jgi:hypothetical protein